jgi:glucokinase
MILAADIGGTNCRLALYRTSQDVANRRDYCSEKWQIADFAANQGLVYAIEQFLRNCGISDKQQAISAVCLGMAGPIEEHQTKGRICSLTNVANPLLWTISEYDLCQLFNVEKAFIINDMEAVAYTIAQLGATELVAINPNAQAKIGNRALIAPGTGLGQLLLMWDRQQIHIPVASEGGHSNFAAFDQLQWRLKTYLQDAQKITCISYEHLISGSGLVKIYQFLCADQPQLYPNNLPSTAPAAYITDTALSGNDITSVAALNIFMQIFGEEAGNLALKYWAVNGVFIGGGIAPKIWQHGAGKQFFAVFMQSFSNKEGRYAEILAGIPVQIIVNDNMGLLGAAKRATL